MPSHFHTTSSYCKRFILRRTFDHERRRQIRTPLGRLLLRIFLCWLQQVRLRGFVPGPLLSQFVGIHPGRGGRLPGALLQGLNQKWKTMGNHRGKRTVSLRDDSLRLVYFFVYGDVNGLQCLQVCWGSLFPMWNLIVIIEGCQSRYDSTRQEHGGAGNDNTSECLLLFAFSQGRNGSSFGTWFQKIQ